MVAEIILLITVIHKQLQGSEWYRPPLYKKDFCLAKDANGSFIPTVNIKVSEQLVRTSSYYKNGEVIPI
jgi:hypothetical protein